MKGDILIPDKYGPTDMRGPGVEAAREAGLILPMAWPAGLVLEEFKSCVIYNEQLKLTQMLLRIVPPFGIRGGNGRDGTRS